MSKLTPTSALASAAVGYAVLGWPVHPCHPGGKTPLTFWKDAATTDIGTIARWWQRWPHANVAVTTGAPGPDVLDVDVKDGQPGLALFERVKRAGLVRDAAAIIATPSGGLHVWFSGTSQGGGAICRRALELKATGGYVLVPPSRTALGEYRVVDRRARGGFIDWAAIVRLLDPPAPPPAHRRNAGNAASLAAWVGSRPEGERNAGLFWAACRALENGAEDLEDIAAAAAANGLPDAEIRRTVESARRRVRGAVV